MKIGILIAVLSAFMVAGGVYHMAKQHVKPTPTPSYPTPVYDAWAHWKQRNGKSYGTPTEDSYRLSVFYSNMVYIRQDYKPSNTYTLAMNKFADLSQKEFAQIYLQTMPKKVQKNVVLQTVVPMSATVDWRSKGAVTAVKNQGNCGSCWAFSTTGSLEGANFLANGKLLSFSEQQLVSCSKKQGNQGCNGGLMDYGFDYVKANGIELESSYPYTAKTGKCKTGLKSVFKISSYADVKENNESQFQTALNARTVSIAVDGAPLQLYNSGIFTKKCGTQLDHGVLAVGMSKGSYYIVKNSWGADWGEDGYVRMGAGLNGKHGQCGMFMQPSYPIA